MFKRRCSKFSGANFGTKQSSGDIRKENRSENDYSHIAPYPHWRSCKLIVFFGFATVALSFQLE